MLVLRRRKGESIQVNCTEVTILEIGPGWVKLGFAGDDDVVRTEVLAAQASSLESPALPLYAGDLEEAAAL